MIKISTDVQTVIWDLDGTLLDSFGIYRDCLNEVLRKRNLPTASEQILRNNHYGHIKDAIASVLLELDVHVGDDGVEAVLQDFYALDNVFIKDVDHHLFGDAVGLAQRLHAAGKRQLVVTNRPHGTNRSNGSPRNLVANSRLRNFIQPEDVLCGDDSEYHKPHREFLTARFGDDLSALGRLVVIGDQFVDAEFAHNLLSEAILVQRADRIAHLKTLENWQGYTRVTPSLADVYVAPSGVAMA